MKVPDRLQPLVDEGIVQEVIRPLMSGKEASLFVVIAGGIQCVAKVYKDAQNRSFRHRAGYTEGRRVRNSRQRRAMEKGTRFGKEMMENAWQNAEVDALFRLSAAGLRVPTPHMFSDGVLLMDLIVDEAGEAAPRLWDVDLSPEGAVALHEVLIREIVYMLCAGMVHGDLSEYNVLLAWDGPIIIDLPQATDAANNPNSRALFVRDVRNLTNFLAGFAPELAATRFGEEIWSLYERAMLFPDTRLTGRWKGSDKQADTRAVLGEIETAAHDARKKREFEGIADKPRRNGRKPQDQPTQAATGQAKAARPPQKPAKPAKPAPAPKPAQPALTELDDLDALLFVEP
jgi:RIO kinase 1